MTDKRSRLPAHLRPPFEKPRRQGPSYRDDTGNKATARAEQDRKKRAPK